VESDLGDDWVDESELEVLDQAKLLSLRISTHRTIGFARATDRLKILQPVIELLDRILTQDGRNSAISNEGYVNTLPR
jgi:copper homeostasis protein CutC